MKNELTFQDGILLCKHVYQSAIEKTLKGVIEQDQIFYKTHKVLNKLENKSNIQRLDELLYLLNLENIYSIV